MQYLIKVKLESNYLCDLVNNAHCVYCAALTVIFAGSFLVSNHGSLMSSYEDKSKNLESVFFEQCLCYLRTRDLKNELCYLLFQGFIIFKSRC